MAALIGIGLVDKPSMSRHSGNSLRCQVRAVARSPAAKALHRAITSRGTMLPATEMTPLPPRANSGSVSLSYDGDPRAAYLLLDESTPSIRRVEYDVDKEAKALSSCGLPHADWIAKMLVSAKPQMP